MFVESIFTCMFCNSNVTRMVCFKSGVETLQEHTPFLCLKDYACLNHFFPKQLLHMRKLKYQ